MRQKNYPKRIAIVGNYLPRICGIATFTSDLSEVLAHKLPNSENVIVIAMDDIEEGYDYPVRVKFEIRENVLRDYINATDFLNLNHIDTVILQHEYGILGGKNGIHIIHMLKNLKIPTITALHTVLSKPSDEQYAIIQELANYSQKFVVKANKAKEILKNIYKILDSKISIIPHGIPDFPFVDPYFYKDKFGLEYKKVILNFELIGPGKGIEFMIDALPKIIEKHDNAIYVILGVTHPGLLRTHGEEYCHFLQLKVKDLSLEDHVQFHNKFVDLETFAEYLIATDIYMTTYLSEEQISSDGHISIIGNKNWHKNNEEVSKFDQQPIEIMNLVIICAAAFEFTGNEKWIIKARNCFIWFLAQNDLGVQIYNYQISGCRDGLNSQGTNAIEGAESTLAWLISLLIMYKLFEEQVLVITPLKKVKHKVRVNEHIK